MKFDPPYKPNEVRDLYARGTWAYALGKEAQSHPHYGKALSRVKGWNPWWIRNWSDVEAVVDGCWMDEKAGRDVVDFFPILRHYDGDFADKPFVLADWQIYDVTIPLFGWKRANGTRRYRKGHVEIPKKNGKTEWAAGIIWVLTIADDYPGAEVYSAAVDRKQGWKMFRAVEQMGLRSPDIAAECDFIGSRSRIVHRPSASFYESLSKEVASKEGLNIHGLVEDEIHVYPNRLMHDTLKGGGRSQPQPLMFAITTAGEYDATSIGWEQHEFANAILNAESGAEKQWSFFPYICAITEEEEARWMEPAMAIKANPNWGISVNPEADADDVKEALVRPAEKARILRYHRNRWKQSLTAWIRKEKWDACAGNYSEDDLIGHSCYGGLDLSMSEDITSFSMWFPPQADYTRHRCLDICWIPEDCIKEKDDVYAGMIQIWINMGFLRTTPGPTVNYQFIRKWIKDAQIRFDIQNIAFDPWGARKIAAELEDDGFMMITHGQGFKDMGAPTKMFMEMVLSEEIEHNNNPVVNWQMNHVRVYTDPSGNQKPLKGTNQGKGKGNIRYKVDTVYSKLMAFNGWVATGEEITGGDLIRAL